MTTSEVKEKIDHDRWLKPIENNNVWLWLFRAKRAWCVPDYGMRFDYEIVNVVSSPNSSGSPILPQSKI